MECRWISSGKIQDPVTEASGLNGTEVLSGKPSQILLLLLHLDDKIDGGYLGFFR